MALCLAKNSPKLKAFGNTRLHTQTALISHAETLCHLRVAEDLVQCSR